MYIEYANSVIGYDVRRHVAVVGLEMGFSAEPEQLWTLGRHAGAA